MLQNNLLDTWRSDHTVCTLNSFWVGTLERTVIVTFIQAFYVAEKYMIRSFKFIMYYFKQYGNSPHAEIRVLYVRITFYLQNRLAGRWKR